MRVLQVISSMNPGGMQTSIMNNFRVLSKIGITFDFLLFEDGYQFFEKEIKDLNGRIFKVTSRRKNWIKNRIELSKFFKENANTYQSVEFHQGITYYLPLKLSNKYKWKNKIVRNHGIDRNFLKRLYIFNELYIKRRICKLADIYSTCNMELNNHLFTKDVIENNKVNFIPNSINTKKYTFNEEKRNEIRKMYKISADDIVLGHIGEFNEIKNHKFLLKVFKELNERDNNYKLMLLGDGPLRNDIEEFARANNIWENVIFVGNVKNVEDYLCSMDIFTFPSLFEGLPMALIEAQACGLPLIISKNISKSVKVSSCCNFIDIKDYKEWSDFILKNIKLNNKEKRLMIGNEISKSIFDTYNNMHIIEKLYKGDMNQ